MTTIDKPPVIFLMGPTASGKSNLAVQLAQTMNGEIISVDSALVYRDMNIGTAKPTLAEQGGIPHHLIDILDPSEAYSTGQFRTQALQLCAEITDCGKLPILVGGTMLYFNGLSHGIAQLPEADTAIRHVLDADFKNLGKQTMHQRLAAIDPVAATRIHPNDPQRVQRALEIYLITGQPLSSFLEQQAKAVDFPFKRIKFVIAPVERQQLHQRIAERFETMLKQGLIAEVEGLKQRGDLHSNLPSMRAVGYRQVWAYLNGEDDYSSMLARGIAATRQLAKRQLTWLRRETDAYQLITGDTDTLTKLQRQISKLSTI